MKELEIDCPCCDTRLLVDVRTGQILRHTPKAELDEFGKPSKDAGAWDRANSTVADRTARGTDAFDAALSKEKSRTKDLDDLFDRAKSKVSDRKKRLEE